MRLAGATIPFVHSSRFGRNAKSRANIEIQQARQTPAQPSWTQAKPQMIFQSSRQFLFAIILFALVATCASAAMAQTVDYTDAESAPVKLFERAQHAHAKGDPERAPALYEAAIRLRPELPQAQHPRGATPAALRIPQ